MQGRRIVRLTVRKRSLRWPVPAGLELRLAAAVVEAVQRRGKFLLLECAGPHGAGTLLIHLGMTGTLRVHPAAQVPRPALHDHVDLELEDGILRYHDPRRFGAILWHDAGAGPVSANKHLAKLGVEPFGAEFAGAAGGALLHAASRGRAVAVKQFLLAGQAVVGVGNIYASESLFRAGIHPATPAGKVSRPRYQALAGAVREVLAEAIAKGGSTLRDFVGSDGQSGYFQLDYFVYDRTGQPCRRCATPIRQLRQGQRSTFYCPRCQRR